MLPIEGITKYEDKLLSPAEKAKDLCDEFEGILGGSLPTNGDPYFKESKRCALIVVQEIISDKHICGCEQSVVIEGHYQTYHTYWSEVKTHIEIL